MYLCIGILCADLKHYYPYDTVAIFRENECANLNILTKKTHIGDKTWVSTFEIVRSEIK